MDRDDVEEGWYADPRDLLLERFWDGQQWTNQVRHRPVAPSRSFRQRVREQGIGTALFGPKQEPIRRHPDDYPTSPAAPAAPTGAERRAEARADQAAAQAKIVCQFCQQAGGVTTQMYKAKQGVSGGKATSALLTGGVSLVAVGLSRKGWVTKLRCSECGMTWEVAG